MGAIETILISQLIIIKKICHIHYYVPAKFVQATHMHWPTQSARCKGAVSAEQANALERFCMRV